MKEKIKIVFITITVGIVGTIFIGCLIAAPIYFGMFLGSFEMVK